MRLDLALAARSAAWTVAGMLTAPALGDVLKAHPDDASFQTTPTANLVGATPENPDAKEVFVGRKYYGNTLHHHVVPFELPVLGSGTFTEVQASFHPRNGGGGDSHWDIPVHLWAIPGARLSSVPLATDVKLGSTNHTARGSLIMPDYLGRHTRRGEWNDTPQGGAESARLCAWLNQAYSDGTNGGRFVFLRLSPRALTPDEAGPSSASCGFGVGTANPFVNADFSPTLTYAFVPSDPAAPRVLSFVASPEQTSARAATLSWSVAGADSVTIAPDVGSVGSTGTVEVTPWMTTTYTLTAINPLGTRVAVVGVNILPPPSPEVEAHLWDSRLTTSPATGGVTSGPDESSADSSYVGKRNGSSGVDHLVIPFELPKLGPGIFADVQLSVYPTAGDGTSPGIDVNLFALPGTRASAMPLAGDVASGQADHRTRGTLIAPGWLNDLTPLGQNLGLPLGGPEQRALSDWLTDAYANGTNAGRYVFLRLSPATLDVGQGTGFRVLTSNRAEPMQRPRLSFTFLANAVPPPAIGRFSASSAALAPGEFATLEWNVTSAESVSISPGIGSVPSTGSRQVSPSVSTFYTLTAQNTSGTRSQTLQVGVGPFRFYRFVPVTLRSDTMVQLAEFQLLRDGSRLAGAIATNPGGNNPGVEGPEKANDASLDTKWLDFNRLPLVLDFAVPTKATAYRFATANDAEGRDPVTWRIEGSHDQTYWRVLDSRTSYPTPTSRKTFTVPFMLPDMGDAPAPPTLTSVRISPDGQGVILTWNSREAASYTVQTLETLGTGLWTNARTSILSGGVTTTVTLPMESIFHQFYRVMEER